MLHSHYFSSFKFVSLFSWSLSKFGKRKRKLFALTPSDYIVWVYTTKLTRAIGALKRVRQFVPPSILLTMYNSFKQPYFDCCSAVWEGLGFELALNSKLQKLLQNRAAGIITFSIVMILAPAPCCKSWVGLYVLVIGAQVFGINYPRICVNANQWTFLNPKCTYRFPASLIP